MLPADFEALSMSIVEEVFPSERKYWKVNHRHVVKKIAATGTTGGQQLETEDFKFVGEVVLSLHVAGTVATLVSSIASLYLVLKKIKSADSKEGKVELLSKALKDAGSSSEQISKIIKIVDEHL